VKLFFAPMEGVAHHLFRRAQAACFRPADEYFMPFICPKNQSLTHRERADINPENNPGVHAIPQILTNNPESFLWAAQLLCDLGYDEVNLNLGCPSSTVVRKGRGAGFLADPDGLHAFLSEVFSRCPLPISLKSRLGMEKPEEFERILSVYNDFPVKRLILHPRVREEQYGGSVHLDWFHYAEKESRAPVVYNGDLFTAQQILDFDENHSMISGIMCGRGFLLHPGLAGMCYGEKESVDKLEAFHAMIYDGYRRDIGTEAFVLMKMKEVWAMLGRGQGLEKKTLKHIHKASRLDAYEAAVKAAMEEIAAR